MTNYRGPDENTLGVRRGSAPQATPGVAYATRQAREGGALLGAGYLGIGAGVLSLIQLCYGLVLFAAHWDEYPSVVPVMAAWILYLLTFAGAVITLSALGERLPTWMFAVFVVLLGAVVALDFIAIWPLENVGGYATASVSAGFGLLLVVTLRAGRDLLVAAGVLGAAFVAAIVATTPLTAATLPTQAASVAFAVLPISLGVLVVRDFGRMVQLELDRVLVQSTVSAPRFAVGMLASEELARLDLAAEELLDAVSTGRVGLPLTPKTASVAASLATELRLHLIEGRRETWLYHAITESELLGKAVTLTDRNSLAGLLDPAQRDGLLSAVWLIVSDTVKVNIVRTVQLTLGPATATSERRSGNRMVVPIVVTSTNVPRNRTDPATWDSIRRIGRYNDSTENSSLRLDIECVVENPADRQ